MNNDWISVEDDLPEKKCIATYINSMGNRRYIIASYFSKHQVESNGEDDAYDEYCEDKDCYFYCEGWYEQQDNWAEYSSIFVTEGDVTHWMPLPDDPE